MFVAWLGLLSYEWDEMLISKEVIIEKLCDYAALIRARVLNVLDSLPSAKPFSVDGTSDSDTRVYPLVQMGMFSVNQENDFLTQLFSSQVILAYCRYICGTRIH